MKYSISHISTATIVSQAKLRIALTVITACWLSMSSVHGQLLSQYYNAFNSLTPNTGILFNKGYIRPKNFSPFLVNSDPMTYLTDSEGWKQHFELMRASLVDNNLQWPALEEFYQPLPSNSQEVPIAGLFLEGNFIPESVMHGSYNQSTHMFNPNTPMDTVPVGLFSNLRSTVQGTTVHFTFDTQHVFGNLSASEIQSLDIDFDDGSGVHAYTFQNFNIEVIYSLVGLKQIRFALNTSRDTFITYSLLEVQTEQSLDGTEIRYISTYLSSGKKQEGVYSLNRSCDNVLDRPVIIVEGFDPVDQVDALESQKKYSQAGLLSYFLDYGYDVIGLQFQTNTDSLQNNAAVVKELIRQIGAEKTGDYEIIIIGESNGAVNARIALAQLEAEHFDHKVGLYISFDSPQAGANIPLGVQEFGFDSQNLDLATTPVLGAVGFIASGVTGLVGVGEILGTALGLYIDLGGGQDIVNGHLDDMDKTIRRTIKSNSSPAAYQQLIRHRDEDYVGSIINPEHELFHAYLKLIGYPNDCRRITLINGSNTAKPQASTWDDKILNSVELDFLGVDFIFSADAYAQISPINNPWKQVSAIHSNVLFWDVVDEKGFFNFNTDMAYDLAPGGINKNKQILKPYAFSLTSSTIDLDESLANARFGPGDFDTGLFYFDESSDNYKRKRAYLVKNRLTPFHDIYANSDNTEHIHFEEIGNLVDNIALREFMFERLFLQNRQFRNGWQREFYARDEAYLGREVTSSFLPEKMIDTAKVTVDAGAHVEVSAANRIHLKPGVRVEQGGHFKAYQRADTSNCHSPFGGSMVYRGIVPTPQFEMSYIKAEHKTTFSVLNHFSGATAADYSWRLRGNGFDNDHTGLSYTEYNLPAGQYSITCMLFGNERQTINFFQIKDADSDKTAILRQNPLELEGEFHNNQTWLLWGTPEGMSQHNFIVERQSAVGHWDSIAVVAGVEGKSLYRAVDNAPLPGFNFYRLRWVSREGKVAHSNTCSVWFPISADFQISPNPASESLTVTLEGLDISKGALFISDSFGHKIWEVEKISVPHFTIPLDRFVNGVYNLTFAEDSMPTISKRFVVLHK